MQGRNFEREGKREKVEGRKYWMGETKVWPY
jgi:hypothetical protein